MNPQRMNIQQRISPKPVLDDKAKENSADGFYANLVFMAGALKYLFETGSDEMINKSALAQSERMVS